MQKIILITGGSSGIGADAIRILVKNNFTVVTTVRSATDQQIIHNKYNNLVKVLLLDVTNFSEIEKIPEKLKNQFGINKLDGLINNAGIALAAPFMHQEFSEVMNIINTNVLAVFKITQVLLPMLGAVENSSHQGRIINISSVAGKGSAPFLAIYSASKHAIEGFSDGLRKEMLLYGIKVIIVAPGSIKTPIWEKGFNTVKTTYEKTPYADSFLKFINFALNEEKNALEVSDVSKIILKALISNNPSVRYAPVPRKLINWYLPMWIPTKIYDKLTAKALGLKPK